MVKSGYSFLSCFFEFENKVYIEKSKICIKLKNTMETKLKVCLPILSKIGTYL